MCHIPEQGFTNNELKRPIGFEGRGLKRNAPTLLNVRYQQRLFVDAREDSLAQQAWLPLLAHNEMNNPSVGWVLAQLQNDIQYRILFRQAFDQPPTMTNVGVALAQYQQSLIAADSVFDQWFYGGDSTAMNAEQIAGFELFRGKARCHSCHLVGQEDALFSDQKLHNTGVGYQASMRAEPATTKVQLAPGVVAELEQTVIQRVGLDKPNDIGRYEITLDPKDRWRFRTPSLRNIAITAPYMHNGEFLSLEAVIEFYNQGGVAHELLSPIVKPLGLTDPEKAALVAFMQALTSSKLSVLVSDAYAAPTGDHTHQPNEVD